MSASPEAVPAATMMGPYKVGELLGEGGMGRVYLGEHTLIGRRVAIKVLNREVATDPEIVSRFFMEARAVNEIRHPNIVEVTDFGTYEDQPFIVMECLEGETLGERLRWQGALPEEVIVRVGRQIASALGAVHERGIVHRDLKPANIFLRAHPDYPDFVKILDFGIAKLLGRSEQHEHKTQVGAALGTPAYMSPEQCLGETTLDGRSDIYSLGLVLYEMATGSHPFPYEGVGRLILAQIQERPQEPRARRPELSESMGALIQRALAKRPADRFATMREVRDALEAVTWSQAIGVVATPARRAATAPNTLPLRIIGAAARSTPRHGSTQVLATPASPAPPTLDTDRLSALVLQRLAAGSVSVPALSSTIALGIEMTQSPSFSFPAALALARRDPRLVSLVIRTANVEPYGGRTAALSLEQSIARLGAHGLWIALIELTARPLIENRGPRFESLFRRPWPHALAGALIARRLIQPTDADDPAHAYVAALLRDVGRPLIATLVSDIERRSPENAGRRPLSEASFFSCIEAHHATARHLLLESWRLPEAVVDALSATPATADGRRLAGTVSLAAALADAEGFALGPPDPARAATTLTAARVAAGLDEAAVRRATQKVKEWVLARG